MIMINSIKYTVVIIKPFNQKIVNEIRTLYDPYLILLFFTNS